MTSHSTTHRRRRVLLWAVGGLVVALVAVGVAIGIKLRSNITVVDVNDALSAPSPVVLPPPAQVRPPARLSRRSR